MVEDAERECKCYSICTKGEIVEVVELEPGRYEIDEFVATTSRTIAHVSRLGKLFAVFWGFPTESRTGYPVQHFTVCRRALVNKTEYFAVCYVRHRVKKEGRDGESPTYPWRTLIFVKRNSKDDWRQTHRRK